MAIKIGDNTTVFKVGSGDCTIYLGNTLLYSPTPPTPTPSGQTPQYAVVPNIQSYTETTYDKVYDMETSKWYMLNNLNQYEEYGLYDTTGSSLSDYTYYDGKLVAIDTTEYQYSGNTWVVVGTYEDVSVTYTIDDTDEHKYSGQTLSTTFKIPTADIEAVGWFDIRIRTSDGGNLGISTDEYYYDGNDREDGTVTSDADYYYYSLPTTQSVVIDRIECYNSTPIHLIVGSKQISVEYAELEEPYGAVSFSSMTEACNYADVYYGLAAHIANNNYVYTTANTWNSVSSQGNYFKFNALANTKYSFSYKASSGSLYASYDLGSTWVNGSNILKVQSGTSVMLKGELTPSSYDGIGRFSSTANFTVEGNAMSLLYGDNFNGQTSLSGKDFAFRDLFADCTSLTNAENLSLPATTLASYCYSGMFQGCTSLTTAPELPATTLANSCYQYMFDGCSSLTTAPELPATTLANSCYQYMFDGCSSLTTAPSLPATTLASYCYSGMFQGCTSLTTAPSLPATTLATQCYSGMFQGCTSLTTAPSLPATNLSGASYCYGGMFQGCTSLTTAPSLPATTLTSNCYQSMFSNCSSLTTAPTLPATTLAQSCYNQMFQGCTSLTTAPSLLATTLATQCYYGMFQRCTNLSSITCLATDISARYCTNSWVNGVARSGTFTKASSMNRWGTCGTSKIPCGWSVQDATS